MTTATSSAASTGPNVEAVTTTPIKHLVVIYQENVSFDHYFGTYPNVANPADDPACHAAADTPSVSGLTRHLLEKNPNAANPRRLDRSQAITYDMDHSYTAVQRAADAGLMDKSVTFTSVGWYDHKIPPIVSQSNDAADGLTSAGHCGTAPSGSYEDRCGYGPRQPLLVISPWARENHVDHSMTDQSSILRAGRHSSFAGERGGEPATVMAGRKADEKLLRRGDDARATVIRCERGRASRGQPET